MNKSQEIAEIVLYYQEQNAKNDQQVLVELLREVQELGGGVISNEAITAITQALQMKESFLRAVIKRYKTLRTQEAPNRLEVCGGPRCREQSGAALRSKIESTYSVKSGQVSQFGGFSYQVTGCMKNCRKGPNMKWNGTTYPATDFEQIQGLIRRAAKK